MSQPGLFDPKHTEPRPCGNPGCAAIRLPGQAQVVTCPYDLEIDPARKKHGRPRGCLNTSQGNLPEGF